MSPGLKSKFGAAPSGRSNFIASGKSHHIERQLAKLKRRCEPIFAADPSQRHTDSSMRRFLKNSGTVDEAYRAIMKYNNWRKEYKVDKLSPKDPDIRAEMTSKTIYLLNSRDVQNRPILYIAVRNHCASDRDLERLTKFTVYMLEEAIKKLDDRTADTICIVFDMMKFTMANMDYQFVQHLLSLLGEYYPQRLGRFIILRPPIAFSGCWLAIRPWLSEGALRKVAFVPNEKELCEYLDPDILPQFDD